MKNNGFLLIGNPESGKSTFLAVNYFLLQSAPLNSKIFLEADDNKTANILYNWELDLNEGKFPKRTDPRDKHKLELSLWLSPKKCIPIYNYDVSGEHYSKFDPSLGKESSVKKEDEELIDDLIINSLVHVVIINTGVSKNPELCREQDMVYNNILIKIRKLTEYQYNKFTPLIIVFTQTDSLNLNSKFDAIPFAQQYFPKTYKQYKFFFSHQNKKDMFFGCSIGEVEVIEGEKNEIRIKHFNPQGFKEIMDLIIHILIKGKK